MRDKLIEDLIASSYEAVEQLNKVAKRKLDDKEVDPEKIKQAASFYKLAINDAFEILETIENYKKLLDEQDPDKTKGKSSPGFTGAEAYKRDI